MSCESGVAKNHKRIAWTKSGSIKCLLPFSKAHRKCLCVYYFQMIFQKLSKAYNFIQFSILDQKIIILNFWFSIRQLCLSSLLFINKTLSSVKFPPPLKLVFGGDLGTAHFLLGPFIAELSRNLYSLFKKLNFLLQLYVQVSSLYSLV